MNCKIFLINLDRSRERLDCCQAEFDKAGLSFERVCAVDGQTLSDEDVRKVYQWNHSDYYKELSKGEIACYLSHRKVWQKIVDDNLDYAAIFEDDVVIGESTADILQAVAGLATPWDCIKLAEFPIKREIAHLYKITQSDVSFDLVTYNKVPNRTCAQVVSLTGAKKLLAHSVKIQRPIDIDLQYWWEKDLNVFGIQPYPIRVNVSQPSTIDTDQNRKRSKRSVLRQIQGQLKFKNKNKQALFQRLQELNKV